MEKVEEEGKGRKKREEEDKTIGKARKTQIVIKRKKRYKESDCKD